MEMIPVNKR